MRFSFVLVLSSLLLPACTLGLRAANGCPEGEVCSDLTPDGLLFSGDHVQAGSDPFVPIARGGTRRLGVSAIGVALPAYEASTQDGSIAVATPTVERGELVLTGVAQGRTLLRLVAAGTDELLDAVPLRVEPIVDVTLAPVALVEPVSGTAGWAFFGGIEQTVAVSLIAADGTRLIDEGLTISGLPLEPSRWNVFQMGADVADGAHPVSIRAGDATFEEEVVISRALGRIEIASAAGGTALVVGDAAIFCVVGVDGARSVWGVPAEIVGDPSLSVTASAVPGCVQVEAVAAGAGRLSATAGALSAALTVDVAPAMEGMATSPLTLAPPSIAGSVRGVRAR